MTTPIFPSLTRRAALVQALALIGASSSLVTLAACESSLLPGAKSGGFFNSRDMATLTDVCDLLIPETETPGAVKAGVPEWIDTMMGSWAGARSRASIIRLLGRLDELARARFSKAYGSLAKLQRGAVIDAIDRATFADPADARTGDYRLLKKLVYLGYLTSEAANPRYLANPGVYRGDLTKSQYAALVSAHV